MMIQRVLIFVKKTTEVVVCLLSAAYEDVYDVSMPHNW